MDKVVECKSLCVDKSFLTALDAARSRVGTKIRMASDGSTYDRNRANRELGIVIYKKSNGYSLGRVGTDVLNGRECVQNGLVCTFDDISENDEAVAAVVGIQLNVRAESMNFASFQRKFINLSKFIERPVFVMGTGVNAVGVLYVTDGETMSRMR